MQLTAFDIAVVSMIAGIVTVLLFFLGVSMGLKRKNIRTHHLTVYSAVAIQLLIAIFWMIPRSLWLVTMGILSDPIGNWYIILHDLVGFTALGLGLVISMLFLIKSGMPPALVKKTRPLMKIVLSLWIIAFLLGIINFYVGYLA